MTIPTEALAVADLAALASPAIRAASSTGYLMEALTRLTDAGETTVPALVLAELERRAA